MRPARSQTRKNNKTREISPRELRRRRRQRHRAQLMSGFAVCTLAVLGVIGAMVVRLDRMHVTTTEKPAALSRTHFAPQTLADTTAGLSYDLLSSPWREGCPKALSTREFSWTAGEGAVAGSVNTGSVNKSSVNKSSGAKTDWYGNACSGLLPRQFSHQSLDTAATGLADAIDPAFYGALRHERTVQRSTSTRVGGHEAWLVEFVVRYPGQHLAWSSELGAVVVVSNTGQNGRAPSMFYVSVPSNLGTAKVGALLSSLR
jgi:hypothetical protein